MATRSSTDKSNFIEENRSLLSTGLVILIIVALGFLAFDTISRSPDNNNQDQTEDQDNGDGEVDLNNNGDSDKEGDQKEDGSNNPLTPAKHVVASGESLWKLAQRYYNDGYKWTVISKENKLASPNEIHVGNVLTIPEIAPSTGDTPVATLPTSHTVVRGDTLWDLAKKHYGSGYEWYKIRDANAGKVGKLANGRPLITPGSVLTIPTR